MYRRKTALLLAAALLISGCAQKEKQAVDIPQPVENEVTATQKPDDEPYAYTYQTDALTPEASDTGSDPALAKSDTDIIMPSDAPEEVRLKEIILDGKLDDWAGVIPTVQDPAGDVGEEGADLVNVYAALDPKYLYIAVKVNGVKPVVNMKFDYDNDGKPDYGANCNLDLSKVFIFHFKSENNPEEIARIDLVAFDEVLEYAVPLELIDNPGQFTIEMWANKDMSNPTEFDRLDKIFSSTSYDTVLLNNTGEESVFSDASDAQGNSEKEMSGEASETRPDTTASSEAISEYSTDGKTFTNKFANSEIKPMVSAGFNYSLVLKGDGTVWGCGINGEGELGNGKKEITSKLVKVEGLSGVVKIDTADSYTLALKSDGTVWSWGYPFFNEQGFGKPFECTYATPITEFSDHVKDIAAGDGYSFVLKEDGTIWYMGGYHYKTSKPVKMKELSNIIAVACKHMVGMALTKDGKVWTWSWEYGGTGNDQYCTISKPVLVKGISHVKMIETGSFQYIALKEDGTLWTWGGNTNGEIGDGTLNSRDEPAKVKGIKDVVTIGSGAYFSLATLSDGSYWIWGDNRKGQFGNGSNESSLRPVKNDNLREVISMSGGVYHTVALKNNGDVVVMGNNYDGILGVGDKKDKLTPYKIMNVNDKSSSKVSMKIFPNGDLADWGNILPVAQGELPADSSTQEGISALYAAKDDKYIYLAAALTKNTPLNISFCLDLDGDGERDYTLMYSTVNNTYLFRFKKKGASVERIENGYGVYGTVVETYVSLKDLGNPKSVSVLAYVDEEDDKNYKEVTTPVEIPVLGK